MSSSEKRYIIGIDLGTTNTAVSYVDLSAEASKNKGIRLFQIPQLTGPGEVSALPVLPSFCYIPGSFDLSKEAVQLPWDTSDELIVGTHARDHGAKVPARLVSSAKSWLCHSNADRRAKILPWGAGEEIGKISPVAASASVLQHIRLAWNHLMAQDEDDYLENQHIIITVPASFDEVARDLTIEAAALAGLTNVILLEEPLAAFYSWLIRHEKSWREVIAPGELVLVCDVGGGTTDLTLITLRETEGTPRFERIAVGDHLILGGDNIDLALARIVEKQFNTSSPLSGDRWKTLCHLCRKAKENILNEGSAQETITMMGTGTRLIGGTLTATLKRDVLENIVLDGFFPVVDAEKRVAPPIRKGISEFGLPYAAEPAITRHIGRFLEQHRSDIMNFLGERAPFPDLILFNGGSLKSKIVQDRIRTAIRHWFGRTAAAQPRVLVSQSLDLAVSQGAAYYGLVKIGKGVRVGSGSPRSYYLGVTRDKSTASKPAEAICIVERGLDEGTPIRLDNRQFEVLANQPVSFDLFSSSFRSGDRCGDVIEIDDTLTRLPPIQTVVQFGRKGIRTALPIRIEAEYTEAGVLELWCRSLSSNHRWQLRFQLRDASGISDVKDAAVFDSDLVEQAVAEIQTAFSADADAALLSGLVKKITSIIQRPRESWPLGLIRNLADALIANSDARKYSPEHEIRWLNLTGFCMRPGFGDGLDDQRINSLWKLYKTGVIFTKNPQALAEWWVMWRRMAGGLSAGRQRQFAQDVRPMMVVRKGGKSRMSPQERLEMWMALANMERLSAKEKGEWGHMLLDEIKPKKYRPQHFWALSRLAARELLYGPVDRVIRPKTVEQWIETILAREWPQSRPVGAALAQMARKTGDRARDLDASVIDRVIQWLTEHEMSDSCRILESVTGLEKQEEGAIFGESLPAGLILRQ